MTKAYKAILHLLLCFFMLVDQGLLDKLPEWKPEGANRSFNKRARRNLAPSCNRHREGTKRVNLPWVWIPNCNDEGLYALKQCHGRYCWCSDPHGKEIPETKKIITKERLVCEDPNLSSGPPERTACQIEKDKDLATSSQFRPLCRLDGSYFPVQCDKFIGYCWCVGEDGNEVIGSKTRRTPNCLSEGFGEKPCYKYRKFLRLLRIERKIRVSWPSCTRDGNFQPKQCSSQQNICWCVNPAGKEIAHTVNRSKDYLCPNTITNTSMPSAMTPCVAHKQAMASRNVTGFVWYPACSEDGFYADKQCLPNDVCWCSDRYGKRIDNRKQMKGNQLKCGASNTPCLDERRKRLKQPLSKKLFIPQCLHDGYYAPVQCDTNEASCWCSDKYGNIVSDSKTRRTPTCFSNVLNSNGQGPCSLLKFHIDVFANGANLIQPKCKSDGFFQPEQCTSSDIPEKHCWCVMPDGSEITNTLSIGYASCHEGDRPAPAVPRVLGPCHDHIFYFNNVETLHKDFVPDCDSKGFFSPLQCDVNRKFCWCVDRYGSIVEGTRSDRKPSCEDHTTAPCHALKKRTSEDELGYSLMCTIEGYFAPLQCDVNKGNCWCVDKFGTEIDGTNIYGRPYCGDVERVCESKRRIFLSAKTETKEHVAPSCDVHGYFSDVQCNHTSNECWCADRNGTELVGTRTLGIPKCGQLPRPCDEHARRTSNYDHIFGVFIPQCDSLGYYKTIQCHRQTNTCWYSNKLGAELPGKKIK